MGRREHGLRIEDFELNLFINQSIRLHLSPLGALKLHMVTLDQTLVLCYFGQFR